MSTTYSTKSEIDYSTGALAYLVINADGDQVGRAYRTEVEAQAAAAEMSVAADRRLAVIATSEAAGMQIVRGTMDRGAARYRKARHVLVLDAAGEWQVLPCREARLAEPGLLLYRFGADLFYANEGRFADELRGLVQRSGPGLRALVVDASAIADLDYSAARMLLALIAELQQRGIALVFGRASPGLRADMQRHGIIAALGPQHLHASLHAALADARQAQP